MQADASPPLVIDVTGVTKSFGPKTVVKNVDMQVAKGQIYGFLGPNGSGKTTFIRMLCGLLTPDAGQGTCLGFDLRTQADLIKLQVGYMAQHFSLYEDLTVRENLEFTARVYGVGKPSRAASEIIERMGLGRFEKQLAGGLSGGWKQRLALAACILHEPKLLLLDEPTAGVDPGARREFWEQLHDLAGQGITALVSTHYMDEAERCHKLAYIAYGDLLTKGSVSEVIAASNLTTWALTGPGLCELAVKLEKMPGVEQAAAFGSALHVSGRDKALLEQSLSTLPDSVDRRLIATSLEEVFINLMNGVGGN